MTMPLCEAALAGWRPSRQHNREGVHRSTRLPSAENVLSAANHQEESAAILSPFDGEPESNHVEPTQKGRTKRRAAFPGEYRQPATGGAVGPSPTNSGERGAPGQLPHQTLK